MIPARRPKARRRANASNHAPIVKINSRAWVFRATFLCIVLCGLVINNKLIKKYLGQEIDSFASLSNVLNNSISHSPKGLNNSIQLSSVSLSQSSLSLVSSVSSFSSTYNENEFEIVTTNYGWRTKNAEHFSRTKLTNEWFNSVRSHPRYNATAWEDLHTHPDPSRRIVAFMDIDTCMEHNYPEYGEKDGHGFKHNMDIFVSGEKFYSIVEKSCRYIKLAAESPALSANKDSRLVLIDCGTGPWHRLIDMCKTGADARNHGGWGNLLENEQVIIAYYGVRKEDVRPIDIGLPPPAVKPINLTAGEREKIASCQSRQYFYSFVGRSGFMRDKLALLDNGKDVYVKINPSDNSDGHNKSNPYEQIMRDTLFAGAPKGDCLWSYRFTEAFSAGAIPVVYANRWLPPFSGMIDPNRVIDWSQCAVFIGEGQKKRTLEILHAIPEEQQCEMQKCALAFWDEFASSRDGWLKGILSWVNIGYSKTNKPNNLTIQHNVEANKTTTAVDESS